MSRSQLDKIGDILDPVSISVSEPVPKVVDGDAKESVRRTSFDEILCVVRGNYFSLEAIPAKKFEYGVLAWSSWPPVPSGSGGVTGGLALATR